MKKYAKLLGLTTFIIICIVLCCVFFEQISAEDLRNYIAGYGAWAPIAYILTFKILPIAFFPVAVLALAAGLLFGFWGGALYTMIGALLNSSLMFWIAKVLAKDTVTAFLQKRLPPKWSKVLLEVNPKRGFLVIFILRLIPVVPYNLINYGAGLTPIKFKTYTLATMLGILPGTLVFLNIGDKVLNIHDPSFIIALALLVILLTVSLFLAKIITPSQISGEDEIEAKTKKVKIKMKVK